MSGARNINAPVLIGLALLLFVLLPFVRKLEGVKPPMDPIEGGWVGHLTFHVGNDPAIWGKTPGPHKDAVLYFGLKQFDSTLERYAGAGQIFILGEDSPRTLHIEKFRREPDGSLDFWFGMQGGIYDELHGHLNNGVMTWDRGYIPDLQAELHRGTEADYRQLLSDEQAGQKAKPAASSVR